MTFVFLDTETTGLDPNRHQVWEIAYAVDDGEVKSSIVSHELTNADPAALHLNGYYGRGYSGDPYSYSGQHIWEGEFKAALQGATLVGANPAFDAAFLQARWGSAPWHYRLLDVESYAMPILGYETPQGLKRITDDLREMGYTIHKPDHSARADVLGLRDAYRALKSMAEDFQYGVRQTVIG